MIQLEYPNPVIIKNNKEKTLKKRIKQVLSCTKTPIGLFFFSSQQRLCLEAAFAKKKPHTHTKGTHKHTHSRSCSHRNEGKSNMRGWGKAPLWGHSEV